MSTYAIGDLHGCPEELDVLLEALDLQHDDALVFLGDYVDRGPGVRTLIDRLLAIRTARPATVFLRGNHEDMLLSFLGLGGHYGDAYLANGGRATLRSYGVPEGELHRGGGRWRQAVGTGLARFGQLEAQIGLAAEGRIGS